MKKLTLSEQSHVVGGFDADECRRVQGVASKYEEMQTAGFKISKEAWNNWTNEYNMYCI